MSESQEPGSSCTAGRAGPGLPRAGPLPAWLAVFAASFALYAATASRGAQWQDSGAFILQIVTRDMVSPRGLALSHPLHHWLGRLAIRPGLVEPALAITLVSALGAALAVACVFGCVRTLTGRTGVALFAAASLGLANTFWHLATVTEVYSLSAALLAAECWCVAAWARHRRPGFLLAAFLLNGLGVANHLQALLTTPVLAAAALCAVWHRQLRPSGLAIAAGLWIVGSGPYAALVLAQYGQTGDLPGTLHSALFGSMYAPLVLSLNLAPGLLAVSFAFVLYNFPNLLLPAAAVGIARGRQLDIPLLARRALLAGLVLHACFAIRYNVVDRHTFFLPIYVFLAVFGGIGAATTKRWLSASRRHRAQIAAVALLLLAPLVYWSTTQVARKFDLLGDVIHNKPYRDDYTYLLIPWSVVERSAERMSREAVELAGPDGLILVEDGMGSPAVRYEALRAGYDRVQVETFSGRDSDRWWARYGPVFREAVADGRRVVLVPADADKAADVPLPGGWRRDGDLYVFIPKTAPATGRMLLPDPR